METLNDRLSRLSITDALTPVRRESLTIAHEAGVDDSTLGVLARTLRLSREDRITLPFHHYETLSRGKGWARKGSGKHVEWGERVKDGYCVGPGIWTIGGNDGFTRKGETEWVVKAVQVGAAIWTIAD